MANLETTLEAITKPSSAKQVELCQVKQNLEFAKASHILTQKQFEDLQFQQAKDKALLDVGILVRARNLEKMRAKHQNTIVDEEIIEAGNAAAHSPNVAADAALVTIRGCSDMAEHFRMIYDNYGHDEMKWWKRGFDYIKRCIQAAAVERITPRKSRTLHSRVYTDWLNKFEEAWRVKRDGWRYDEERERKLDELEQLTKQLVTREKAINGQRQLWCKSDVGNTEALLTIGYPGPCGDYVFEYCTRRQNIPHLVGHCM